MNELKNFSIDDFAGSSSFRVEHNIKSGGPSLLMLQEENLKLRK
jgi:hypothetical protein